ncbi:MAG TPA: hypothetical protein DIC50_06125 [Verrucomicrobia subdivision 3 bacterium]|nr:hypothetical protein [Limisphaerales bacterium]
MYALTVGGQIYGPEAAISSAKLALCLTASWVFGQSQPSDRASQVETAALSRQIPPAPARRDD